MTANLTTGCLRYKEKRTRLFFAATCITLLLTGCAGQSWNRDYKLRYWEKYRTAGESALFKKEYKKAVAYFEQAVAEARALGATDFRLGVTLAELAQARQKTGNNAAAEQGYDEALAVLKASMHQARDPVSQILIKQDSARVLSKSGSMYASEKKFDLAEEKLERAVKVYDTLCDYKNKDLPDNFLAQEEVKTLSLLAECYAKQRKFEDAERSYRKALELARLSRLPEFAYKEIASAYLNMMLTINAPDSVRDIAADFQWQENISIATQALVNKDYSTAERCLNVCNQDTKLMNNRPDRAIKTLSLLASLYAASDRINLAETACRQAMQLTTNAGSEGAYDLDQALADIARFYILKNRGAEAIPWLMNEYELRRAMFGSDSIQAADVLAGTARALYSARDFKRAILIADKACEIVIPRYSGSKRGMHASLEIAQVYHLLGSYSKAEKLYNTLLVGAVKQRGELDERTIAARQCLVSLLLQERKFDEAAAQANILLTPLERDGTQEVANRAAPYLMVLGNTFLGLGKHSDALRIYKYLQAKHPTLSPAVLKQLTTNTAEAEKLARER